MNVTPQHVHFIGHERCHTIKLVKFYLAKVSYGMPARFCCLKRKHNTATAAEQYGKRFCERYNRMFPVVQS